MKVKFAKRLLWFMNAVLVIAILSFAVRFFILGGPRKTFARTAEQVLGAGGLPRASPPVKYSKPLPADTFRSTHELAISGNPPAVERPVGPTETARQVAPLERDYELHWTKVDIADPFGSQAHLFHKPSKTIRYASVGTVLDGWKLVRVRIDEADFEQEKNAEKVTLKVSRPVVAALPVGADGAPREVTGPIGAGPGDGKPPREGPTRAATESRPGFWDVPSEEQAWWEEYGEEVLEKEVTIQPVTDPDTGRPAGLMLKGFSGNSIAAARGLQPGDIVRSINGVPVNSRQEAVNYVKGPGKGLPKYVVEIERKGRVFTTTFNVRK